MTNFAHINVQDPVLRQAIARMDGVRDTCRIAAHSYVSIAADLLRKIDADTDKLGAVLSKGDTPKLEDMTRNEHPTDMEKLVFELVSETLVPLIHSAKRFADAETSKIYDLAPKCYPILEDLDAFCVIMEGADKPEQEWLMKLYPGTPEDVEKAMKAEEPANA
jgi:hypothetical protein